MEVSVTVGDAFKHFNGVVTAFGKSIGVRTVKSVKNELTPVMKHGNAGLKLWNINKGSKEKEVIKALACNRRIRRIHKKIELFFEQIGVAKIRMEGKHTSQSIGGMRRKFVDT